MFLKKSLGWPALISGIFFTSSSIALDWQYTLLYDFTYTFTIHHINVIVSHWCATFIFHPCSLQRGCNCFVSGLDIGSCSDDTGQEPVLIDKMSS